MSPGSFFVGGIGAFVKIRRSLLCTNEKFFPRCCVGKKNTHRDMPFFKGARRRVGKTTLAKRLAEEYRSSIFIRFDRNVGANLRL